MKPGNRATVWVLGLVGGGMTIAVIVLWLLINVWA